MVGPIATRQNLRFFDFDFAEFESDFRSDFTVGCLPWPVDVAGESDLSKSSQAIALVLESYGFKEAMNLSCYY